MFNECFVADGDILVFDEHLPGEEKDLIYAYDLINKQYIAHGEPLEGRTYNGETKSVVNKDGKVTKSKSKSSKKYDIGILDGESYGWCDD